MVSRSQPAPVSQNPMLVTAFEPFGGERVNPSAAALHALRGRSVAGHPLVTSVLPVSFAASLPKLRRLVLRHRPCLVLCLGQAGGRANLSIERIAVNVQDARIPDNTAAQPIDEPVEPGGPAAYFSTLPIKAMHAALRDHGLAGEVSNTAGTFVCNHVFYGLMHLLATEPRLAHTRGGFMHLPWLPGQGEPCLPLAALTEGIAIALLAAATHATDPKLGAGHTH